MSQSTIRKRRLGVWFPLFVLVCLVALAAVSVLGYYQWRYVDRIYPGVTVVGTALDGMTSQEAEAAITDALTPYPGPDISLQFGDRRWTYSPHELGVTVDARAMASQAFAIGRKGLNEGGGTLLGNLWEGLRTDVAAQWTTLRQGATVPIAFIYNDRKVAVLLDNIAREINLPAQEATFNLSGLEVSATPGRMGQQADIAAARTAVLDRVRRGVGGVITLKVHELRPTALSADVAVRKAKAILGRSLLVSADTLNGRRQFSIDAAQLHSWLTLSPITAQDGTIDLSVELDREKVRTYVQNLASQMDQPSFDARLDWDRTAGQVIVVEPSKTGQQVDVEAGAAAIEAALTLDRIAAGDTEVMPSEQVTLPITIVQPRIDSDRVGEMGIVELVSEGTSWFKGSPAERVHNIVTAASKFDATVVPPDEEFSFNSVVGDVSAANGFGDALVIAGDRTAVGIGGGVCQVSTTAFRAAFWGGFPLVERWAHGYVVGWYGEPGMDASIYTPSVDFRFRNDTGHFILVESDWDTAKGRITFYIYGTKPNRTVEMKGPEITNRQPAPPPAYQEDATLVAGKMKQVDWAKEGMDVVVRRIIRDGNGQVREEKIVSKYRPWQAIFLYGPGTELPAQAGRGGTP